MLLSIHYADIIVYLKCSLVHYGHAVSQVYVCNLKQEVLLLSNNILTAVVIRKEKIKVSHLRMNSGKSFSKNNLKNLYFSMNFVEFRFSTFGLFLDNNC